ncbi:hypothetical protein PGT21_022324 [Puccinia graminis f. sp. tritici]|uniref:Uncharacterized protein n=2 Tax=Puccinia graminis f. sp. tritici TaxID=56615 RepID=H6QTY6_PUCGT|nr:uncharacterized protein PGTG_22197 [Puccinia graminis f. sp. tritici CRL 75-36-700-3]EHS64400.1 hypothetical protein PGTG_22197 [Puccinia graminis f. sp. tritici CRL 75-36-700-3]KAA1080819.1 hypothetical protein PGT21_022324 [Puccinia graminis f. sp. tritici]KAA1122807.1 hypothetical protein PGTUg99_009240 [Puccinia graminis f. sp. tritici]
MEDPHQRILDEAEVNVHRRGIDVSNKPTCSTSARMWDCGTNVEKKVGSWNRRRDRLLPKLYRADLVGSTEKPSFVGSTTPRGTNCPWGVPQGSAQTWMISEGGVRICRYWYV